jgi:hypothetical protein
MSLFEALPEFGIKARVQTLLKVLAKCSPVTYADAIAAAAARAAPQSAADGDVKAGSGSSQQAGGSAPAKQIDQSLLASLPSMIKDIGRALPSEVHFPLTAFSNFFVLTVSQNRRDFEAGHRRPAGPLYLPADCRT